MDRRRYLAMGGLVCASVAGCLGTGDSNGSGTDMAPWEVPVDEELPTWDDLGELSGRLTVYSGRSRDQIDPLFEQLEETYPHLDIRRDYDDNISQVNGLIQEGDATPADVFYTQDSGALAVIKREGLFRELPADIASGVSPKRTDPDGMWSGISGRVRAVLFNTDQWSGEELPTDILAYAYDDRFQGTIAVRPSSGTFQAFIVAMMELEGEETTRAWVRALVEQQDVRDLRSGSQLVQAVSNGDVTIALDNQYYAARLLDEDPSARIDVTFTENDAGCLFNVSGVGIPAASDSASLAAEFTRHLLAKEGQEFFVEVNGEYPVMDGVDYVGGLPDIDAVNPPAFDLNTLGLELTEAVDLLREEGLAD